MIESHEHLPDMVYRTVTPGKQETDHQSGFHPIKLPGIDQPMKELVQDQDHAAKVLDVAKNAYLDFLSSNGMPPTEVEITSRGLEKQTQALVTDLYSGGEVARRARVEAFQLIAKSAIVPVFEVRRNGQA